MMRRSNLRKGKKKRRKKETEWVKLEYGVDKKKQAYSHTLDPKNAFHSLCLWMHVKSDPAFLIVAWPSSLNTLDWKGKSTIQSVLLLTTWLVDTIFDPKRGKPSCERKRAGLYVHISWRLSILPFSRYQISCIHWLCKHFSFFLWIPIPL